MPHIAPLTAGLTVNFDNSMTVAEMQALIDAVPRALGGFGLVFQFADGTYTMTDRLIFKGFYGGAFIKVNGNTSETDATALHTTQQVHLDGSSAPGNVLRFESNSVYIELNNLKISHDSASGRYGVFFLRSLYSRAQYSYLLGNGIGDGEGVYFAANPGHVNTTYFSNQFHAVRADQASTVFSQDNADTGTQPAYGLRSLASVIMRSTSDSITGSTADTLATNGGEIR